VLSISDPSVRLENVIIEGDGSGIGVRIEGSVTESVDITNCRFQDLETGIEVIGALPIIRRCIFEDITGTGVIIRYDEVPPGANTLGRAEDLTSGWNRFVNIGGKAVVNERESLLFMENNDWDSDNAAEIAGFVEGPNDFEPFLAKGAGILPATIVSTVWDGVTRKRITDGQIFVSPGGFMPVTENIDGVYIINAVPPDSYGVRASAQPFDDQQKNVVAVGGAENNVPFAMGESAGKGGACGCAPGGEPGRSSRGDLLAVLLAACAMLGFTRRSWRGRA
jgi:hypothetical protein